MSKQRDGTSSTEEVQQIAVYVNILGDMFDARERQVTIDEAERMRPGVRKMLNEERPDTENEGMLKAWAKRQAAMPATVPLLRAHGNHQHLDWGFYIARGPLLTKRLVLGRTGELRPGVTLVVGAYQTEEEAWAEAEAVASRGLPDKPDNPAKPVEATPRAKKPSGKKGEAAPSPDPVGAGGPANVG